MKLVWLIKMCVNETYSNVHIHRHFSAAFAFWNGLEQADALSPLQLNFALECTISKVQENQNWNQMECVSSLVCADNVNIPSETINMVKNISYITASNDLLSSCPHSVLYGYLRIGTEENIWT
jgi:hypothetical protein